MHRPSRGRFGFVSQNWCMRRKFFLLNLLGQRFSSATGRKVPRRLIAQPTFFSACREHQSFDPAVDRSIDRRE
jgi:hypothetical protein